MIAAPALLLVFVLVESKTEAPLLPLRVVFNRNRSGVYGSVALAVIGNFGLLLFLTFYLQVVRDYSPLRTGAAFLPLVIGSLRAEGLVHGYVVALWCAFGMLLASSLIAFFVTSGARPGTRPR